MMLEYAEDQDTQLNLLAFLFVWQGDGYTETNVLVPGLVQGSSGSTS